MLKEVNMLISSLIEKFDLKGDELFVSFIKQFYSGIDIIDINHYKDIEIMAIAQNYYNFTKIRNNNKPKFRIYNPDLKKDGWHCEETIIEIVNDDMPFLIDSIYEVLNKNKVDVKHIIHPIISVERDKNGKLNRITESDIAVGKKESMVHIRLEYISEQEFLDLIENEILDVLDTVSLVVSDWRAMLSNVDNVIEYIKNLDLQKTLINIKAEESPKEVLRFLNWLKKDNFVFLGFIEYDFKNGKNQSPEIFEVQNSKLGIFRKKTDHPVGLLALPKEVIHSVKDPAIIEISKANRKSVVHRIAHMDSVSIKKFDKKGQVVGEMRFVGLFTSVVYYQSANQIPLIADKINYVIKKSDFSSGGYKAKELVSILNAYPRDELFQINKYDLFNICMGVVSLSTRPRVRLFIRVDKYERFLSCLVYVPKERYSTDLRHKIEALFIEKFNGSISNYYTQVSDSSLARLLVIVKTKSGSIPKYSLHDIEDELCEISSSWMDQLKSKLFSKFGELNGKNLFVKYSNSFPIPYISRYNVNMAVYDIDIIEKLLDTDTVQIDLYQLKNNPKIDKDYDFELKIYNQNRQLHLSKIMPILENLGFNAIDELTFLLSSPKLKDNVWVHHFRLHTDSKVCLENVKEYFELAFKEIWCNKIEDDAFNKLVILAGLKPRQVILIRAYAKYLRQSGLQFSQGYIQDTLANHPKIAALLVELFYKKFDPNQQKDRQNNIEQYYGDIKTNLQKVENSVEDLIINMILDLIMATLRSNYFQKDHNGNLKDYISFKFDSSLIPNLPKPVPYREIFVYSSRVEGIHLRGGKVSRGGLRWSDRKEDFRTEVLSLMKTQIVKNSIIVPIGAKGGFIVKNILENREDFLQEGILCYKTFLRGLLDITDNIVDDKIVKPQNVVCFDEDDPYLVVAADKGTATFSNFANEISLEYNFWLQDAFASGGSAGYDHKKMGITAKGAWISVVRHFLEKNIDIDKESITVAGIGDMAGDVFGNGMLLCNKIKLVAAFNHLHIFIDPNPDPAKSFAERERMFALPRSSWEDYDTKLISKGGGVFSRKAKSIKLTNEIKELLDITEDNIKPDELIKYILKARIDLLWNGGIGTYVKAEFESNEEVGDKANDGLRVNGNELRVKVIGEGGNLGCTQAGRIEYALNGGRINADFIDNSAGVDCSDHEVNIKIACGKILNDKKMTLVNRNKLLEEMEDEVSELVLRDNEAQARALNVAYIFSKDLLESQVRLIETLEEDGLLNRKVECIPSNEMITRRYSEGASLTRPELATLISYSKIYINNYLLDSSLPDLEFFNNDLLNYFPSKLQKKYKDYLISHPLRKEIISTIISNDIVNRLGSTFIVRVAEETGRAVCDIVRAYIVVKHIFNIDKVFSEVESLDGDVDTKTQAIIINKVMDLVERKVTWFLQRYSKSLDIEEAIAEYQDDIRNLYKIIDKLFPDQTNKAYEKKLHSYKALGIPDKIAENIALAVAMSSSGDIVAISHKMEISLEMVGKVYFEIGKKMSIGWIRTKLLRNNAKNKWDILSIRIMLDELFAAQRLLTEKALTHLQKSLSQEEIVGDWCEKELKTLWLHYQKIIENIKSQENIDLNMLNLAIRKLNSLA